VGKGEKLIQPFLDEITGMEKVRGTVRSTILNKRHLILNDKHFS
jgi:hypothetical protein